MALIRLSPLNKRRWRNFKANRRALWSLYVFGVLFFLSLSVVSYFWSENQALSNRGVFKIVQQLLIFFMVFDVFKTKDNLKVFNVCFRD